MSPGNLFVATVAVCLVNGLVSPILPLVFALHPVWLPELLQPTIEMVFYLASLMVSTGTLLLSGVPAALVERFTRATEPRELAMAVWLGSAALLTLPGLASRLG